MSHFEAPHFQHVDDLFVPKIDQIYHFIQILLGPILNFERCTPTDFDPECPPPASSLPAISEMTTKPLPEPLLTKISVFKSPMVVKTGLGQLNLPLCK